MADLQFSPASDPFTHPTWVAGTVVTVYEDAAGTVLAAISLTDGGDLVSGSTLTVTSTLGQVPVFYGRDPFADTLFLSAQGALVPVRSVTRPDPESSLSGPSGAGDLASVSGTLTLAGAGQARVHFTAAPSGWTKNGDDDLIASAGSAGTYVLQIVAAALDSTETTAEFWSTAVLDADGVGVARNGPDVALDGNGNGSPVTVIAPVPDGGRIAVFITTPDAALSHNYTFEGFLQRIA